MSTVGAPPAADRETPESDRLWTRDDVARYIGVTSRTTYLYRLPTIRITARTVRFEPAAIKQWLAARMHG